jgi:hypothetical protein
MPPDYTHIEKDGTPWKNVNSDWYFWRDGWGWIAYIGPKPASFFNKFR